jgi:hypothetical protein
MLSHYLTIDEEDISPWMVSCHLERYDTGAIGGASMDLVIANVYGMFTSRWRDDVDDKASLVTLALRNERNNCIGDADIRQGGELNITIESDRKDYYAFCGYASKVDYDEKFVKIKCRTADDFLEQNVMPDGIRPVGGTAYIAVPPAQIILDVISQHKTPRISVSPLTADEMALRNYPLMSIPRKRLPGYVSPIPPGGNNAIYPSNYDYLSPTEYAKSFPNSDGSLLGWKPGTGVHGNGFYRKPGDTGSSGSDGGSRRTCTHSCRYKMALKCCKTTTCAYKKKGTLCRQVKCPYEAEKRGKCFTSCPYDTFDCADSDTSTVTFECPTCKGTGSSSTGGICEMCGGTGSSNNAASNAAIESAQNAVSDATNAIADAGAALQKATTPAAKSQAEEGLKKAQAELETANSQLKTLQDTQEIPASDDSAGSDPEEMVTIDFWDPQIIKDQVQGGKGLKYSDVIRAICKATGGTFYIDEKCRPRFVPPNDVVTPELVLDLTNLVTKQGFSKAAMSHANIVVVYGAGVTEPGASPVERERHKVVGFLQENTDSVYKHGSIHASEVDVHYLPKQSQVEELARSLIDYYKGDEDKANVEAIGILPMYHQKVKWRVPIGPLMDTKECQFGSTAIMAVVSGRVTKVVLDYSAKGWTVEIQANTVEIDDAASKSNYRALPPYAFTTKKNYDELMSQYNVLSNADNTNTEGVLTEWFTPGSTDGNHLWVKVVGNHLELADPTSSFKDFAFGSIGSMASFPGYYALRWTDNQKLLQDGIIADLITQSKN